jgi:hypothetical protein
MICSSLVKSGPVSSSGQMSSNLEGGGRTDVAAWLERVQVAAAAYSSGACQMEAGNTRGYIRCRLRPLGVSSFQTLCRWPPVAATASWRAPPLAQLLSGTTPGPIISQWTACCLAALPTVRWMAPAKGRFGAVRRAEILVARQNAAFSLRSLHPVASPPCLAACSAGGLQCRVVVARVRPRDAGAEAGSQWGLAHVLLLPQCLSVGPCAPAQVLLHVSYNRILAFLCQPLCTLTHVSHLPDACGEA